LILLQSHFPNKEILGGNGQKVRRDMEESLLNQNDEPMWYENDRLIQEYLNRSRNAPAPKKDRPIDQASWLKMIKKSRRKT
jgi:hypothetical protein